MAVRESLNKTLAAEKIKLSVGDFITKAVAMALRKHPGVNASYEADAVVMHPEVNVGIAVAMEGGLMVPVLRNADAMGLKEIRTGTEAIAAADPVRHAQAEPDDGRDVHDLEPRHVRRQAVRRHHQPPRGRHPRRRRRRERPVVEGNSIVLGTVMSVTLTADHRAVDGAMAAEFMRTLKGFLEEPASMLL